MKGHGGISNILKNLLSVNSNRKTKIFNIYLYVHVYSFLLTSTLAVSIIDTGQSASTS